MVIQFTLQELMYFLVAVLGIAAGIILLSILWHIKKMLGNLRTYLERGTITGIIENADHISSNVRETTDRFRISTPVILQEVEGVANAARGSIETGLMGYLHIFEEVVQIVYRIFANRK